MTSPLSILCRHCLSGPGVKCKALRPGVFHHDRVAEAKRLAAKEQG